VPGWHEAASVQLAAVPLPTTVVGRDVSTGPAPAGTGGSAAYPAGAAARTGGAAATPPPPVVTTDTAAAVAIVIPRTVMLLREGRICLPD
jgi:hypothetical protein